ncbi:DNA mismatch repair protein MutL [Rickenella mellea]|uniref:DNA mismatch repair protein MutL n=1 Tax=Rickenella mellea TaxID=50990 RepID=A0A4Y7QBY6_9AGAM|nr:DNA mismatch repair protein MutL [Rickenella mellea]
MDPQPIRRLQEALINRIAAGEIIHRPASALKELLENALDAQSTSIRVTLKDGGLKLLQIQDNGCGIRKADLGLLAERFATSKIARYEDLGRLRTYGFRGEALASVSHVAHLSVVTKVKGEGCAWKAHYLDGKLAPAKPGLTADPKPCAGNDGTTITVEDLFYNTPTRLSALRSSSEEYARILDVITRYAVHNPSVSFVCKKSGSPSPDLSTPSNSTTQQAIRLLYGANVARDLLSLSTSYPPPPPQDASLGKRKRDDNNKPVSDSAQNVDEEEDGLDKGEVEMDVDSASNENTKPKKARESDDEQWSAEAFFTSANYHAKKMVFLLFINHRLVESPRLKRALENVYANILPKGTFPFIYLSISLPPHLVDPNVHPTKREVHFLHEEKLTERVCDKVLEVLVGSAGGGRRVSGVGGSTTQTQTILPGASDPSQKPNKTRTTTTDNTSDSLKASSSSSSPAPPIQSGSTTQNTTTSASSSTAPGTGEGTTKKVYAKSKVRTSLKDRTLDAMFPVVDSAAQSQSQSHSVVQSQSKGAASKWGTGKDKADFASSSSPGVNTSVSVSGSGARGRTREIKESECFLTSINDLRKGLQKGKHIQLTEILSNHTFVGIVDLERCLSLIQHSTRLYLVNHAAVAEELFYQLALRQFGNMHRIHLSDPPPIRALIKLAVQAEESLKRSGLMLSEDEVVDRITERLTSRADMLDEYFSVRINKIGELETLPLLLRDYTPNLNKLPLFLMRLGPQVDWTSEKECFASFMRELAYFYTPGPVLGSPIPASSSSSSSVSSPSPKGQSLSQKDMTPAEKAERWQIQHVVFPALRGHLVAPRSLLDRDVVQVANLPDLYRVFERC